MLCLGASLRRRQDSSCELVSALRYDLAAVALEQRLRALERAARAVGVGGRDGALQQRARL